jgi:hypothetical protein
MTITLALYLALVASLLFFLALLKPALLPQIREPLYGWEQRISWVMLSIYLGVSILRLESRAMDALATQGLSAQNKLQVVLVAVAAVWSFILVTTGRVSMRQAISGPGFWLLSLMIVFALSVLWSSWPTLTIFRVTELAVFWVVACHLFGSGNWARQIESLMWAAWLMYLLWGVLLVVGVADGVSTGGYIVGIMTSNSASLLSGLLLLWSIHRCLTETFFAHVWKLPILAASMIMFGSLATVAIVLFCIATMVTMHTTGRTRIVMVFGSLCLAVAVSNIVIFQSGGLAGPVVDATSSLFGKSRSNIVGMTGRLELWTSIWQSVQSQPWGFGFAAFERTFSIGNGALSWKAGNAHNGFISAWLGAGWLAFAVLLTLFASMWARMSLLDRAQRPMYAGLLLLIMLNNLTVPAVGGRLTVVFLFLMALAHIPVQQKVMEA